MKQSLIFIFVSIIAITMVSAGSFMNGNFGFGTTTPEALVTLNNGALLAKGTAGNTPISGGGRRFMWIPAKSAIRAGEVTSNQFDDANIGSRSAAFGYNNIASGTNAFAAGSSTISSNTSTIAMGLSANANGVGAIALGRDTDAGGNYSLAIGDGASTNGISSVALGTGTSANGIHSVAMGENALTNTPNAIAMRFHGGYSFYTNTNPGNIGVSLASDANSWGTISDKNRKENFRPVDTEKMLQKLDLFTFTTWNYKGQEKTRRHYGPMAQNFQKAFGRDELGKIGYEKKIESYEFSAVNFNLIAALKKRTEQNKRTIEQLTEKLNQSRQQNQQMKAELDSLRRDVKKILAPVNKV